jgi:two-component system, OmpR family, sensor histidine kinase VicK
MDIRDPKYACSLFVSEIQHAQSEVLIAVNSILYLDHLAETGLVDSLKQAQSNDVNVMIIYSEERQNKDATSQIVSTIKNYAQIKCVSGIYGTIFLIDNSKVLTINEGDDAAEAFVVYSNNKSIVKNIGSLFDSLWNEKEMLDSIIAIKDNLADSNKQLVEANRQLKIHDKIQTDFINMAAHELRTPITPILGYAEILQAEQEEEQVGIAGEKENDRNKNKRNNINAIIRNAKRLEQVSQRILDTASIDAKILKLYKERLNLADVLLNAVDDQIITVAQDFERKNDIKLRYEPSEDIIIHADKIRLTQVISNILSNAVKYTKKGTISITIKKENDNAIVAIQDTGLGIDAHIMSRLFSKFATKSDIGGTGLGLFISKSIIEAHGGTISAGNNENGKRGATFTFSLPLSK